MAGHHHCRRGHDNPVGRRYCEICGLGMVQASMVASTGTGLRIRLEDGTEVPIDGSVILGRDADISLDRSEVSRHHVRLQPSGNGADGLIVTDLGSTNGTFVSNGDGWNEVRPGQLVAPGTVLALGPVLVTIVA